jgi:MHS family proline/betaine transporter-like MFS transporter
MTEHQAVPRRILLAGAIGSILEWYDFSVFGAFTVILAHVFFANSDQVTAVLATFAVFGVGFVARPVGAIIFGAYGDRLGRRRALILTVLLMAVPTTLMALLPTPASIGVTATVLLIALRFVQGLSAGGEVAGGYTFLSEQAGAGHYARTINWAGWVTFVGIGLGAAVGATITGLFPMEWVYAWGWRVAFAFNLVLLALALLLRRGLTETPEFEQLQAGGVVAVNPVREAFREVRKQMVQGFFAVSFSASGIYFITAFMPAFLAMEDMLSIAQALLVTLLNVVVIIVFNFIGASLSDRHGSRRIALIGTALMILLGLPLWWLATRHDTLMIVLGQFGLAAILGLYYVPQIAVTNRSFPTRLRYVGHSVSHNFASAAFGGTSALVATYLLHVTGNVLSSVLWPFGLAAVTFAILWTYPRLFAGEQTREDDAG